jgi:CO/xanthine dehydrogenase Mo-binding subunit
MPSRRWRQGDIANLLHIARAYFGSEGKSMTSEALKTQSTKILGRPIPRYDAYDKACGRTKYAGDAPVWGWLHLSVLRSPHPSARIVALDVSEAKRIKGVVDVITASDVPNPRLPAELPGQLGKARAAEADAPVLAIDRVRYVGEPVALVVATSAETARQAVDAIRVEYEPLPCVCDPFDALDPGWPKVAGDSNVIAHFRMVKGDVDAALAEADVIVDGTYRTQFVDHAYLEPESGMAWVDEDGVINIRTATQVIEHYRSLARMLGVPQSKVRIQGTMVGGGFGGREDMTVEPFLALAAWKTGKPVRIDVSREDSFFAHTKRHPFTFRYRTGLRKDGTILGMKVEIVSDAGAYIYLSPYVLIYALVPCTGPYRVPHLFADAKSVLTNNPPTSAMRGFGGLQACFAYERHMDDIAQALGLDPRELRRRNFIRRGDTLGNGQVIENDPLLDELMEKAWSMLGDPIPASGPSKAVGRGIAVGMVSYGRLLWTHDTSSAYVGLELDGSVVVRSGVPDIGGGQSASLVQITSEVLGVSPERVSVYISDSALTPLAGTTTATRQLYMSGNAVLGAAKEVRANVLAKAADMLEANPDDLDIANGEVYVVSSPEVRVPLATVAGAMARDGLPRSSLFTFKAPFGELPDPETFQGRAFADFTFGAQAADVEVDLETGEVTVRKVTACYDAGRCVNRASVEGQIEGGVAMGMGMALTEEYTVKGCQPLARSFSEYILPTAVDVPDISIHIVESGQGVGPFGAKGMGEPAVVPVVPAVVAAVSHALGRQIREMPATPEKVWRAVRGS